MKSLLLGVGVGVVVALASLERDASAGVTDEVGPSLQLKAGVVRAGTALAKAKKHRRPAGSGGTSDADDASGADDDAASKSSSAGSDTSDSAQEEEMFGPSKKKKAAAPASDDGDSSGDGGAAAATASKPRGKSVEAVEAKASQGEQDESATPSAGSALEFGVGGKALFRQLAWSGDARATGCSPCLGPYSLSPGPETGAWLEFYPAAFGTSGFAANVGLVGRFDYGFGVATTLANGDVVATKFRDFMAGIKVRMPFGTFVPNLTVSYGQQLFEIAQQDPMRDIPQVAYQFIRPALGARYWLTPTVALDATAGYLMVLDPGSGANHVRSMFPDATAFGFDISASVAFRLMGAIGLRAGADLRQYVINLNDKTQPTIAGAVDRYIVAWAGVEVVLDGMGAAAGGDDEPVKPSKRKRRHAEPKSDDEESESSDSSDD